MNKEIEKMFNYDFIEEGISPTADGHDMSPDKWNDRFHTDEDAIEAIKTFIDTHFNAKLDSALLLDLKSDFIAKKDLEEAISKAIKKTGQPVKTNVASIQSPTVTVLQHLKDKLL